MSSPESSDANLERVSQVVGHLVDESLDKFQEDPEGFSEAGRPPQSIRHRAVVSKLYEKLRGQGGGPEFAAAAAYGARLALRADDELAQGET